MKTLIIFLFVFAVGNCVDYCKICENHIACKNNGKISKKCRSKAKIIDITSSKNVIVDEHNKKRNEIALGKVSNLEPALRMTTMEWDDELAKLAELNVKTCNISRDECCSTELFLNSKQNICLMAFAGFTVLFKEVYLNIINHWFNEYKNANMSIINKYYYDPKTVHFTLVVDDRNFRLGCATIETQEGIFKKFVITCNYATGNMKGFPVYRKGRTASGCKTGVNPNYPGLCSVKEQIDVDDYYS